MGLGRAGEWRGQRRLSNRRTRAPGRPLPLLWRTHRAWGAPERTLGLAGEPFATGGATVDETKKRALLSRKPSTPRRPPARPPPADGGLTGCVTALRSFSHPPRGRRQVPRRRITRCRGGSGRARRPARVARFPDAPSRTSGGRAPVGSSEPLGVPCLGDLRIQVQASVGG